MCSGLEASKFIAAGCSTLGSLEDVDSVDPLDVSLCEGLLYGRRCSYVVCNMRQSLSLSCFVGIPHDLSPEFESGNDYLIEREDDEDSPWLLGRTGSNGSLQSCDTRTEKKMCRSTDCKLPKEVVEKILAMIPFPQLFKVRSLSKAWYKRFLLPSEGPLGEVCALYPMSKWNDDTGDPASSISFQKLVSSYSSKWSVYCPVILGDQGLIGYDPVNKTWQGLITDLHQLLGSSSEPWLISSCGPLICGVSQSTPSREYEVLVTNVLSRRWRKLPSHPTSKVPSLMNLVFCTSNTYKVFLVTEDPYEGPYDYRMGSDSNRQAERRLCTQTFDSADGMWTMSQSTVPAATSFAWRSCSVYFNGKLYCLAGDDRNPIEHPLQVWVFSLDDGSWTELRHPFGGFVNYFTGRSVLFDLSRFRLFVCGSKVMLVLAINPKEPYDHRVGTDTLFIFEIDPETGVISEKAKGPPTTVLANSEHIASDGENIYFCTLDLLICYPVVVFNVGAGEWSCLAPDFKTAGPLTNKRWADFAFQPGLNPFMPP